MHVSVTVDELDTVALTKPAVQDSHTGWLVLDPATFVNFPASHFACAVHVSVTVDEFDATALKKPAVQDSHTGSVVLDPATSVNFPASHFACAAHTDGASANLPVGAVAR